MLEEEREQAMFESAGPEDFTRTKFLLFGLDLERTQ